MDMCEEYKEVLEERDNSLKEKELDALATLEASRS
jgi:hypothetical protein